MEKDVCTLVDVHRIASGKGSAYLGPVRCCVVGYVVENEFPKRFTYRGCSERKASGMCKVSLEGPMLKHCEHNALSRGCYTHFFCFEVALSDESLLPTYGKMAMRASIWEAAGSILNVTPVSMASLDEAEQFKVVYDCLKHIPLCDIDFRVSNGDISITELQVVSLSSTLPQWHSWKSPCGPTRCPKLLSDFGTEEKPPVKTLGSARKYNGSNTPTEQFPTPSCTLDSEPFLEAGSSTTHGKIGVKAGRANAVEKLRGLSSIVRDLAGALSSFLDFYSGSW